MWLILHSGIYFYILLNFGLLRFFPRILFGFLSSLDRLSIRRKAEKSSDEIFSKGIFILLQNVNVNIKMSKSSEMKM